ncbi:MAG: sigma-70 family RNA polymerase sigma factor [Woeseiaceae bacterium]|nr:sigma-70 family RNA polymerase sigma factor [Woeseiaceae bacterium]
MPEAPAYYADGPEALIVSLAMRGDKSAFSELVRRRQPGVRNLFRRFSNSPELADDMAQRVFLKAWQRIRQLKHADRFGGWLKKIAVNEWIDYQRKHGGIATTELDDVQLEAPPVSTSEAIDLDAALAALPAPVRLCIVLSYHENLSHSEIAELTGIKLGTIKSHIRRGSELLRDLLKAYGGSV